MMKDVLSIILVLIILLLFPGSVIYLGGVFVFLEWDWVFNVEYLRRFEALMTLLALWIIFAFLVVRGTIYNDDRRDPKKKG